MGGLEIGCLYYGSVHDFPQAKPAVPVVIHRGYRTTATTLPAHRTVAAALDLIAAIELRNARSAVKWDMRLGIHTGIVVAGVVGKRRLLYDLFGDTVNIASRMENHGQPGRVNLSAYSYDLVRDRFECAYLGKINVKGKGEIDMYSVLRALPPASPPAPATE